MKKASTAVCDVSRYFVILPMLILIMILVINVIQSSIALSLGLVGALSIVRFRTPIKEAEELVYIFLAIAIGLGLGARYIGTTTVTFILAILVILFLSKFKNKNIVDLMYMEISHNSNNLSINDISKIFENDNINYNLVRIDDMKDKKLVVYSMQINDTNLIPKIIDRIKDLNETIEINAINNSTL
jgi:uncharacterized membrane protein YhiD involved in acid resistance